MLELVDGGVEIGEVDDRDRVQPVGLIGELLSEEVVAAAHALRPVGAEELELLPVAARVHEAVVGADAVHPRDPLGRGRRVQRVQDHRTASLPRQRDEARQQLLGRRPLGFGERGQQVARDAEGEHLDARGELVEPRLQRVVARRVARGLPMGVDVDDHPGPLSLGRPRARIQRCYEAVEPSVAERTTLSIRRAQADGFGSGTSSASRTPRPISAAQRKTTRVSMSASGSRCSDC